MPAWVLSAAYALHMAATAAWVGGLLFQALFLPTVTRRLDPLPRADMQAALARRFQPLAWISLAILTFTGLSQMAAHPAYSGLLDIQGRWAQAILVKHLAFGVMVIVVAFQTWVLQPRLGRLRLHHAAGAQTSVDDLAHALQRSDRLTRLNAALALLVLVLTAIARTS